jgi:hypothetical protein
MKPRSVSVFRKVDLGVLIFSSPGDWREPLPGDLIT